MNIITSIKTPKYNKYFNALYQLHTLTPASTTCKSPEFYPSTPPFSYDFLTNLSYSNKKNIFPEIYFAYLRNVPTDAESKNERKEKCFVHFLEARKFSPLAGSKASTNDDGEGLSSADISHGFSRQNIIPD